MTTMFATALTEIGRITPLHHKKLEKLGISTVRDLLYHLPTRYDDYSQIYKISEVERDYDKVTLAGTISDVRSNRSWKKRMTITNAVLHDASGNIRLVWFNDKFAGSSLENGMPIRVSGKVGADFDGLIMTNPVFERAARMPVNTARLVPIYRETAGLTSRWLRWQIHELLKQRIAVPDIIPESIREELNLPNRATALRNIHFPRSAEHAALAEKYFAFEEMFIVQIHSLRVKKHWSKAKAIALSATPHNFITTLPFALTNAQKSAIDTITRDITRTAPMNRLLNGDVGSGKTVVAASAAEVALASGYQVAILAPTEVLARQHYETFVKLFAHTDYQIALLTGSSRMINGKNTTRKRLLARIAEGEVGLIIGTHALIQDDVHFAQLALVVVDEQHRFGVQQRAALQERAGTIDDGTSKTIPHFLTMTATPIPRSLALAFFGDLDLSVLDEMPNNRKTIKTKVVGALEREQTYQFIRNELLDGFQCYVILPLVDVSQSETLTHIKSAIAEQEHLQREIFPTFRVGLLHGRMKSKEKQKIMEQFKNKELDILVSTAVVEVGIDVPNASTMIIEGAERFGLSQLHQFRGRIGRGERQSHCFLFTSKTVGTTPERLEVIAANSSGFDIAQADLELRGPGAFFGTRQSGMPDITMANIKNIKLIELARTHAQELLQKDPDLTSHAQLSHALTQYQTNVHLE